MLVSAQTAHKPNLPEINSDVYYDTQLAPKRDDFPRERGMINTNLGLALTLIWMFFSTRLPIAPETRGTTNA
ncbi:hypothetical protein O2N63_13720 [Aliiroseovarius sp. KMU-50]|uniref:Uncharacterized protein n=1 Tax=Aliiroseovarius salicola TaxID=3009082 RepID=A0ABT4W3P5_9RHOB|nr:hypothetical protein [Aliiroseovarius sp. KMU-50]MDA5095141.1 hypothetical protein [Aliiroseovarius sp. KMU-50]